MGITGYITTVVRGGSIPKDINSEDETFLFKIMEGYSSAYKIFSSFKKEGNSSAYKNVNKRVKKLFHVGLIEQDRISRRAYEHGALNYIVTTRGLVYLFAELGGVSDILRLCLSYPNNILFQTFIYPYFENKTIQSATYSLIRLIENYIEICCQQTRYAMGKIMDYQVSEEKQVILTDEEIMEIPPIATLYLQLYWSIKSFLLQTAVMKEGYIDWRDHSSFPSYEPERFPSTQRLRCTANDKTQTYELLSQDFKFMQALMNIDRDFNQGYKNLFS